MAIFNTDYYTGSDLYSDGEVENRILEIVRTGKPLEDTAERSFPVLYHLSKVRENILSWYPFRKDANVLEIGAGPGAITGLLCAKCAHVTSAELSHRRSTINYERHKDCENLTIMAGNLNDMEFPDKFDYVVLNGVFEYAGSFTKGPDPYGSFLAKCRSYLKDDGILLIAIENRLGLKYFSGAPEDHTDNYMEGLKDYPDNTDVHTFSKNEWIRLLEKEGLSRYRFYYPYPDYKFPNEIFTDSTLKADGFTRNAWNFNPRRFELFPERQMAAALCAEGVMDRFMNSFLIEAGTSPILRDPDAGEVLYAKVNADRGEKFQIQTLICESGSGKSVIKAPLNPDAADHIRRMHAAEQAMKDSVLRLGDETYPAALLRGELLEDGSCRYPYLGGQSLGRMAADAADLGDAGRIREIIRAIKDLIQSESCKERRVDARFEAVFGTASDGQEYEMVCPANIDLIPDNVFLEKDADGQMKAYVIDAEWVFDFPVPSKFILWRAVNDIYSQHAHIEKILPQEEALQEVGIGKNERQLFWKWADHFERGYVGANRLALYARSIRKADLKDLMWSGEDVRMTATLYMDLGQGYNETDALHTEVVVTDGAYDVTLEIPHPEKIRSMRFDPLEGCASILDLSSEEAVLQPVNASLRCKKGYEFLTMDPAYSLKLKSPAKDASGESVRVRIHGRIETKDVYWALSKSQELVGRYRRGPAGAAAKKLKDLAKGMK